MKTEAEFKQALKEWILAKNARLKPDEINDDTAIIEQRIISSLQIMDLILHLEKLTGCPVDIEQLKPGVFKNINSIYNNFAGANPDAK